MTWILTASGRHLDFLDPRPDQIHILDIAQGLANECRYTGQCKAYYSVAQHSFHASFIVPRKYALEALLHDASEAYLKDIPTPLKRLLPDYRAIEARVMAIIRAKFNLPMQESPEVKRADLSLLVTERRDLMPHDKSDWGIPEDITPMTRSIIAANAPKARSMFLNRYLELTES